MLPLDIILLSLAGLLSVVLYALRAWRVFRRPEERQWTGTPFDATRINPRIQHLRQNYLSELHLPAGETRRRAIASAQLRLAELSYFKTELDSEGAKEIDSQQAALASSR